MDSDKPLIKVERWDVAAYGVLSEAAIRKLYTPPKNYRISPDRIPANTNFHGSTLAGQIYIIQGSCGLLFDEHDPVVLSAGDIARFPEGDYEMYVLGSEEVHLVRVWELPPWFTRLLP